MITFRVFSVFAAAWGTPSGLALLGFLDFVSLSGLFSRVEVERLRCSGSV